MLGETHIFGNLPFWEWVYGFTLMFNNNCQMTNILRKKRVVSSGLVGYILSKSIL